MLNMDKVFFFDEGMITYHADDYANIRVLTEYTYSHGFVVGPSASPEKVLHIKDMTTGSLTKVFYLRTIESMGLKYGVYRLSSNVFVQDKRFNSDLRGNDPISVQAENYNDY